MSDSIVTYQSENFDPRALLTQMFSAAVESVSPANVLPPHLPEPGKGRVVILGAGKAAASMAVAVEQNWKGDINNAALFSGFVVTRDQHDLPTKRIKVELAGHPVPDARSRRAAERMLKMAAPLERDDHLICLMSGGASALTTCPPRGISMEDLQAVNRELLAKGVPIGDMNALRKHVSIFSGGRLALKAYPAKVTNLIISDVPGDNPSVIGSGPTATDSSTFAEALDIVRRYGLELPDKVMRHLHAARNETIKPNDPRMDRVENIVIANAQTAMRAAAKVASAAGFNAILLGDRCEGEAKEVAKYHAAAGFQYADYPNSDGRPVALISGGETTVTLNGQKGNGGRNGEFALACLNSFNGHPRIYMFAGDTDGIDGSQDNAGVFVMPDSLKRALALGMNPKDFLAKHDSHGFFSRLGDIHVTGPTYTNVNDFHAILAFPSGSPRFGPGA